MAAATQTSAYNSDINVSQSGFGNSSNSLQTGDNSTINVSQSALFGWGGGNSANVTQTADSSIVNVTQLGNANWANVYQH